MKNLLFLCGPNGIGKTTISKEIVINLPHSAYVDSDPCRFMNPFVLDAVTIPTIAKNISDMILNYFDCPLIQTVVFSYGFHGRRKEVFETVLNQLSAVPHHFIPYLLWCSEEEHLKRLHKDNRSTERIETALHPSRKAFGQILWPKLDITEMTSSEAALEIIRTIPQDPFGD